MGCIKNLFKWKTTVPVLILIFGLSLFIYGSAVLYDRGLIDWPRIALNIGEILLVSVLFSFLLNITDFMGIIKSNIEDIIYSSKNLKKREDIEEIWKRVSIQMFKEKMPQLSDELLNLIKDTYLPSKEIEYYENYKYDIDLKFEDIGTGKIIVNQKISYKIKTENKCSVKLPLKNSICVPEHLKDEVSCVIESFKIDGKEYKKTNISDPQYSDGAWHYEHICSVQGAKQYNISTSVIKKYLLDYDNYIGFSARWLIKGMEVTINFPNNLDVNYTSRATAENFTCRKKTENSLIIEYNGLILRHQGFILMINKKLS